MCGEGAVKSSWNPTSGETQARGARKIRGRVVFAMTVESIQYDRELLERGWSALPAEYRMPEQRPTLDQARAYCQRLATTHYENFHVASWFLPTRLRPHFYSIYAYCRISDDLGDEVGNREQSLALLDMWGGELDACYRGEARHPVFVALAETIRACDIPRRPLPTCWSPFARIRTCRVTRRWTMCSITADTPPIQSDGWCFMPAAIANRRCSTSPLHFHCFAIGELLAGRERRLCARQDLSAV